MTNQGDDCYFYFYSTCTKGDSCPFRHCEAAMGSEVVCNLWQENSCFRKICKFRHMEIKKKRGEIPCYWENQPAGCQKPHCAFHHEKPRFIDGVYVPPSKVPIVRKEWEEEAISTDTAPPAPAPVANPANPQLRGVFKTDTLENVPSPTHPPVVINTVDDEDEDEDDQFSEEGEDRKAGSDTSRIVSPRKFISSPNQDDSLNFGIKTLEEIRLRKALKANLKKTGQTSAQANSNNGTVLEKENIRSSVMAVSSAVAVKEDSQYPTENPVKRQISDRLGRRKFFTGDAPERRDVSLKRRLADRLGEKLNFSGDEDPPMVRKPVRERVGLPVEPACSETEASSDEKLPGEIRIKTLEEIKQEKASRSQDQARMGSIGTTVKVTGPLKRPSKALASPSIRTFSEILHAKKKLEGKMANDPESCSSEKSDTHADISPQGTVSAKMEEVRVKTLEEIRREKATRLQGKVQEAPTEQPYGEKGLPKRRILRINKAVAAEAVKINEKTTPGIVERSAGPGNTKKTAANGKEHSSSENIKVKTFEEIMLEKRLRKQQVESSLETEHSLDVPSKAASEKERSLITTKAGGSTVQLSPEASTQPKTVLGGGRWRAAQKDRIPIPPTEQNSMSAEKVDSPSISPKNSMPSLRKRTSPVSRPDPSLVSMDSETQEVVLKKSPAPLLEPKAKPKLNVKPSIMKQATQVQLSQKQKEPESPRSAVAAVKPLSNSAVEVQSREPLSNRGTAPAFRGSLEKDAKGSSRVSKSLVLEDPGQGLSEESSRVQTAAVSLTEQGGATLEPAASQAKETQSTFVAPKTPAHGKARRLSTVSSRAPGSTVDDFDELMNEFTDERLEDEMEIDPGKGEDDLLLELSEMIDS